MRRLGGVAAAFAILTLAACATTPPPRPVTPAPRPLPPIQRPPEAPPPVSYELSALPGWAQEDHAAAFAAYRTTCQVSRDPDYAAV